MLPEGKGTGRRAVEAFSFTFIIFYGSNISIFKIFTINFYWRSKVALQHVLSFYRTAGSAIPRFGFHARLGYQEHRVGFLALYSRLSLVTCFIRSAKVPLLITHFCIA